MQINEAKFLQNGKCGYVLKPSYMRKTSDYNPSYSTVSDEDPVSLVIKVNIFETFNFLYKRIN
jgi:phosphatidylinositol phospholipase C gamma-1